jgi:hypothetical protein
MWKTRFAPAQVFFLYMQVAQTKKSRHGLCVLQVDDGPEVPKMTKPL